MTTLVVGASGATGKQLVEQLLKLGQRVKVIVRSPDKLPESWKSNNELTIIQANVLDISESEMIEHIQDCNAVVSCLGHNLSWKGVYGKPRKLVTDAIALLCNAIKKGAADRQVKLVLMNTAGNRNKDLNEPISGGQKMVLGVLRLLLPPHVDNEKAAEYLRTQVGQKQKTIEWVVVRPDNLVNEEQVSEYEVYPSPLRSAIFNAGTTSRINVGHFMAELITEEDLWNKWKGKMPVIYNVSAQQKN